MYIKEGNYSVLFIAFLLTCYTRCVILKTNRGKGVLKMKLTLKAARVNKGLTQSEAAQAIGISLSSMIDYENGKRSPYVTLIPKNCMDLSMMN